MAERETLESAASHSQEPSVTELQMRLLQLAREQNALLRQLMTRGVVGGDDLAESAAAPEPACLGWESLEASLSYKPRNQINEEIPAVFKRMYQYLIDHDERIGLLDVSSGLARHRKQVIKQFERLLEDPKSLQADSLSLHCARNSSNYEYIHARATNGGRSIVGIVWTINIRIGESTINSVTGDGSISANAWMDRDDAVAIVNILLTSLTAQNLWCEEIDSFSHFILEYVMDTNFRKTLRPRPGFIDQSRRATFVSLDRMDGGPGIDDRLLCTLRLRSFKNFPEHGNSASASVSPISLHRYIIGGLHIQEFRRCLGLLQSVKKGDPTPDLDGNYVIVRLLDEAHYLFEEHEEQANKLQLCEPGTGIAMFQRVIWTEVDNWTRDWLGALELLEQTSAFPIADVVDPTSKKAWAYDANALYFKSNQLLRLFEDWIDELQPDLQKLWKEIDEMTASGLGPKACHIVEINWMTLLDHTKASCDGLRTRIKRKRDEIQILQDGLFNIIQVREATKGTKMNEIILLFTIATILYLPATFVTAFMALDLFQTSDRSEFWRTFGTVAAATYAAAGLGLLAIYRKETVYPLTPNWILNPTWIQAVILHVQRYLKERFPSEPAVRHSNMHFGDIPGQQPGSTPRRLWRPWWKRQKP